LASLSHSTEQQRIVVRGKRCQCFIRRALTGREGLRRGATLALQDAGLSREGAVVDEG